MIKVRSLKKEDNFNDLISLSRDFFEGYESHHNDFFKVDKLTDNDIVDYFSTFIVNEDGEVFIALIGDRIVGYLTVSIQIQPTFWKIKKVGEISGFMVHKNYRRKKIGSQLIDTAKVFFKKKDVKYFTVYTAVRNKVAIDFYKKSGLAHLLTTMISEVDNVSQEP